MKIDELMNMGMKSAEARDFVRAIECFMAADEMGDDNPLEAAVRGASIGMNAAALGWFDTAEVLLDKAGVVIESLGGPLVQAGFALNYGNMLHNWCHNTGEDDGHRKARGFYSIAAKVSSSDPEASIIRAHAGFNRANVDFCLGHWNRAVRGWDAAYKSYETVGATQYLPDVLRAKGDGHTHQGKYSQAKEILLQAADGFAALGRHRDEVLNLRLLAHALFHEGAVAQAESIMHACARIFEATNETYLYVMTLVDLSTTLTAQGKDGAEVSATAERFLDGVSETMDAKLLASIREEMTETMDTHTHPLGSAHLSD